MQTAGRAVVFSGIAVALGLALLVAMPLPFIRMLGVAGFLIPIVSIVGAVTLQPVLLSLYGRRGTARHRLLPGEPTAPSDGFWARLARSIMARPLRLPRLRHGGAARDGDPGVLAPADAGLDVRDPAHLAVGARLRPAPRGGRRRARSRRRRSSSTARTGSVLAAPTQAAVGRLVAALERDPEVAKVYTGSASRFVDPSRRYEQVLVAGRHDYGFPQAQAFVKRLRGDLIPAAGFPADDAGARRRRPRPGRRLPRTRPTPTSCR